MCKGPEAEKTSGYLRRRKKVPVNGKQGKEWKKSSESQPDHTGLRGPWPRIRILFHMQHMETRRFQAPMWSNCQDSVLLPVTEKPSIIDFHNLEEGSLGLAGRFQDVIRDPSSVSFLLHIPYHVTLFSSLFMAQDGCWSSNHIHIPGTRRREVEEASGLTQSPVKSFPEVLPSGFH